ncbi:MAG: ROK family transcriptional regulator [Methylobacterium mesophilicum]|nr:ROK family transcriptional regulator [Methylobacterium mesophilicum]
MRDANERLVLSLVRQHDALPKSEIARMTGLSAQTVSVIVRSLEEDGLMRRLDPVRGRIGQPSVPIALDAEGAFSFGVKIGRRSAELVLIDFLGRQRGMLRRAYRYPEPADTVKFVADGVAQLGGSLKSEQHKRITGLGIAMPFEMWSWADAAGAPRDVMEAWRHRDIRQDIQAVLPFPVYEENDATAACGAELIFGQLGAIGDFIYFYLGAFAGGGVVLNNSLYSGRTGNAGALGSMPVPSRDGPRQLIDVASLAALEAILISQGHDGSRLWSNPDDWDGIGPSVDEWMEQAASALAYAIAAASSVIDFEAAVIDGWMPTAERGRLIAAVRSALGRIDAEGLVLPEVHEGTVGSNARALGAASLPLADRFLFGSGIVATRI